MIKSWEYKNEYNYLKNNILKAIDKVLKSGNLFFGNELEKFKKIFSLPIYPTLEDSKVKKIINILNKI